MHYIYPDTWHKGIRKWRFYPGKLAKKYNVNTWCQKDAVRIWQLPLSFQHNSQLSVYQWVVNYGMRLLPVWSVRCEVNLNTDIKPFTWHCIRHVPDGTWLLRNYRALEGNLETDLTLSRTAFFCLSPKSPSKSEYKCSLFDVAGNSFSPGTHMDIRLPRHQKLPGTSLEI